MTTQYANWYHECVRLGRCMKRGAIERAFNLLLGCRALRIDVYRYIATRVETGRP